MSVEVSALHVSLYRIELQSFDHWLILSRHTNQISHYLRDSVYMQHGNGFCLDVVQC